MPRIQALTASLALIGAHAVFAAPPRLPGTVLQDLKATAAECTDAGGVAQTGNAVKRADLNADGKEDYVLDVGSIQCDGAASIYGDRDKSVTVYVGDGTGGARSAHRHPLGLCCGLNRLPWVSRPRSAPRCGRPSPISQAGAASFAGASWVESTEPRIVLGR